MSRPAAQVYLLGATTYTNTFNIAGNGWSENAAPTGMGAIRFGNGSVVSGPVHLQNNARLGLLNAADTGTISGVIDDGGNTYGIEKAGSGALTLSGASTYGGATTVSAGTLTLSSVWLGSGAVSVSDGGTLGVSPAAQNAVLGMDSLNLGSGGGNTTNTFDLGVFANPTAAIENVTNAVTLNGTVVVNVSGTGLNQGPIPLITWGSIGGSGGFQLGSLPAGFSPALTTLLTSGNTLYMISSGTSSNAYLTGISFNPPGSLAPAFTTNGFTYWATNAFGATPTVTVTDADPTATNQLSVNGGAYATLINGVPSSALKLTLIEGITNVLTVLVTAQDGVTTNLYTVNLVVANSTLPSLAYANMTDYGFMWWSNGPASSHYAIKTSRYAMLFNWHNLSPVNLFPLTNPSTESSVLTESWADSFPASAPLAAMSCQVVTSGVTNAVTATSSSGDVQVVECGKYFQRRWQMVQAGSLFVNTGTNGLEVASWPDRISFVLRLVPSQTVPSATIQMTLSLTNVFNTLLTSGAGQALAAGDGSGFVFLKSVGSSLMSINPATATVTVSTTMSNWKTSQEGSVGLIIYPATNTAAVLTNAVATETAPLPVTVSQIVPKGGNLTVSYDADQGWYDVILGSGTSGKDGILRAAVVVTNTSSYPREVRLNFDGVPFYIPGITAVLRDASLDPLGIPVQLSKDWSNDGDGSRFVGDWFHGLTMLTVPANANLSVELTMVGQDWGGMPAATHSQLSIIGYAEGNGCNQQWDESALGNYGESLTYDVEHGLTDNDCADSRPLMLINTTGATGQWTGNFGGAEFLRYYNSGYNERRHSRMRTQYVRYGPNLTEAVFAGQTDDGAMALRYSAGLTRSTDCTRGLHELQVNVVSNFSFSRLVFFQEAADTYCYGPGNTLAYGNATNLMRQWTATYNQNQNIGTPVALTGPMPWGATLNCAEADYTPANRGFIIRSWQACINGVTNVPPYIVEHSVSGGSVLDIVPPPGVTSLQAGDYVHAVIERIYVPQVPGEYYGVDGNFATAVTNYSNSYEMVRREAVGNSLTVNVQSGVLEQTYPSIEIGVTNDFAQFSVTGGLNYVPVTFTGVSTYKNPVVEQLVGSNWVAVDQTVKGNDFWQADYNSTNLTWDITFNLKMGSEQYQDIPALMTNAPTSTFRFQNPNTGRQIVSQAPVITSVSPANGPIAGGTLVTITGLSFVTGMTVQFGANTPVAANFINSTQVTVLTPANAPGAVDVTVQNPDAQTATLTGGFTYVLPPPAATISSVLKSGTNLVLVWVGGTNESCPLLTATNVAQARATWTPVTTNVVGADGLSTNSIPITPGEAQRFYLLSVPYN